LNKKLSEKDKKDWEDFLLKNEKLPNKYLKSIKKKIFKEKSIDLHGSSLDKANELIEKFINSSYEDGVLKLIVVTGKGIHSDNEKDPYVSKDLSILKYSVPEFIKNNKELMKKIIKIQDATIADGGSGAFYIFLKNKYT
jgi:DNA-nicking Smr family endonuclease